MTKKTTNNQTLKLIASHTLVVAIATNPYLIYLIADLYKITTNDTTEVVVNQSLVASMSLISGVALLISIVTFSAYIIRKEK